MNNFFTTSLSKWTQKPIPPKLFRCLRYLCLFSIFWLNTALMQGQDYGSDLLNSLNVTWDICAQEFIIDYDISEMGDLDYMIIEYYHENNFNQKDNTYLLKKHNDIPEVDQSNEIATFVCNPSTPITFHTEFGARNECTGATAARLHFPMRANDNFSSINKITIKHKYKFGLVYDTHGSRDFEPTTAPIDSKIVNITATPKGCNKVKLDWQNEGTICASTIDIFRNNSRIATNLPGSTSTYTDNNATNGTNNYSLTKRESVSIPTVIATANIEGDTYPVPKETPNGFTASNNDCGGVVNLSWNWNFSDHTGFTIQRSTDSNFNTFDKTFEVDEKDIRNLEDDTAIPNTPYFYRIAAKNECGPSIFSSKIDGDIPDIPTVPTNVTAESLNNKVKVTWTEKSTEDKFYVRRILQGGGFNEYEVPKDTEVFEDNELNNCQTYYYKIKAENECGTSISAQSNSVKLTPDLSSTLSEGKFSASKGYRPGEVRLEWTAENVQRLDVFKIYRKIYNSSDTGNGVLIATVPATAHIYSDYDASANTLYEYTLEGQANCEDAIITTNTVKEVGFRSPSGLVSGNINFEGGIAAKDVKVVASTVSGASGNSLHFNGVDEYAEIPHDPTYHAPTGAMTIGCWIHPESLNSDATLLHKSNGSNGFGIRYLQGSDKVEFWAFINDSEQSLKSSGPFTINQYTHIGGTYDGEKMKLFVDGTPMDSLSIMGILNPSDTSLFVGGKSPNWNFHGNIDELVFLNKGRNNIEMERDHARILSSSEEGLIGYWRFDEGTGPFLFDATEISPNIFNEAHGTIEDSTNGGFTATWSSVIPTASQLGMVGYTDEKGSYIIDNVRYKENGENFTIVPIKGVHEFDPNQRILFIGDGSTVHNNTDFTDISSFQVTGIVRYEKKDEDDQDEAPCFAEGVLIKIDGEVAIKDGTPVQTDENGAFVVQVPIGEHFISVEKILHDFEVGRWPATGKYNFQDVVNGIEFIDNTLITVVGRVVGGKTEGDKKIGFGRSINNIGVANITFAAVNGCRTESIQTDSNTGEYTIKLPPLEYQITQLDIPNNASVDFGVADGKVNNINLFNPLPLQIDTSITTISQDSVKIESVSYHLRNDYVYRTPPKLEVSNSDKTSSVFGEKQFVYTNNNKEKFPIDIEDHPFLHPIFKQGAEYKLVIEAFEEYLNKDNLENIVIYKDSVKDGTVVIDNKLAVKEKVNLSINNGSTLYSFKAGYPNPSTNSTVPEYDYTKSLDILLEVGASKATWEPITNPPTNGDKIFRGYIMGGRSIGSNFTTQGPELVSMIVRDPPGSYSSAFFEKEETIAFQQSWSLGLGASVGLSVEIDLGADFSAGIGFVVDTDTENTFTAGMSTERKLNTSGEYVETWTSNQQIATKDEPELVGAPSDIFVGRSVNIIFGKAENFSILPKDDCGVDGVVCTGPEINGYRIGKRESLWVVPGGFDTKFVYTQNHIVNSVIPKLIELRNNLFTSNSLYTAHIDSNHELYGSNNDDPRWKENATSDDKGKITNLEDYAGFSYTYDHANETIDEDKDGTPDVKDLVRMYNQQIRLWEEALALNEQDKLNSLKDTEDTEDDNITFDGGAIVEGSSSFSVGTSHTVDIEFNLTTEAEIEVGGTIGGVGGGATATVGMSIETSAGKGLETESTKTFGYTLSDDPGDAFTVDIADSHRGYAPVFRTVSGQTSCPHEDEVVTQYHQPGTVLSARTLQGEKPTIDISPSLLVNVPADEAASFTLNLGNDSETGDGQVYKVQVVEGSNEFGAIIQIDGQSPNREFLVEAGETTTKTLTVKRGPHKYSYENIEILIHSTCQFENGTGFDKDIFDKASLSVHFLPVCTDVEISSPEDQWVVNNSFNNTLPIGIGGYDINYPDLEKIRFQYRPISSPNWVGLQTYYKEKPDFPDDAALIPNDQYITYNWDVSQLPDANYYIRAVSECSLAEESSENLIGIMDRVNPHPFGTPSPGDGILSPNDDISIQFNETIEAGALTSHNFDIRGVLNGAELRHGTSVYFNGTDSKMTIPEGIHLASGSFSIESWVRRSGANDEECIFSQGVNTGQSIFAGFNANDQLTLRIAGESVQTTDSFTDTNWHHIVFSYDAQLNVIEIFVDSDKKVTQTVYPSYEGTGRIGIGYSLAGAPRHFDGNLHELRLWGKSRTEADIAARRFVLLTGREAGILGVWQMDEAVGTQAAELLRERHATLENITWTVEPLGRAYSFNGSSDYLSTSGISYNDETDMTLEFWFNSTNGNNVSFFSNGKGDGSDNATSWNIGTDANGKIIVTNQDKSFEAVSNNYFDGQWHHFALVVNRLSDMAGYIDGNLQNTTDSDGWGGFGGAKIFVGCRGWQENGLTVQDRHFAGSMDEVRLWKTSRKQEQIVRDRTYKQAGDEFGLDAYWAFEDYEEQAGVNVLVESLKDLAVDANDVTTANDLVANGGTYSDQTPPIRLPRPVQKVNYTYSVNNDKIIITPTDPPALIENVTLDITVRNIQDLQGNKMQSPVTWIAYVDKNQTVWEEQQLYFEKTLGEPLSFSTRVLNQGGDLKNFTIDNLPTWLTANPRVSSVAPNSYLDITFTVDESLNIGEYTQDLQLNTDFGFSEILVLELKVSQTPPEWEVNPSDFAFSMNVVGQVKVEDIFSTDDEDILYAVVNNEIRAKAQLQYAEAYDKYLVFMDIYSNQVSGETVEFRFWDASQGRVYVNITPQLDFASDTNIGTPSVPQIFEAPKDVYQTIPISSGWNWISFNLTSNDSSDVNKMLKTLQPVEGNVIKGLRHFDQYFSNNEWFGSLSANGGIQTDELYKVQINGDADLVYTGAITNPSTKTIEVVSGWNWIGYIGLRNLTVNAALTSFNATDGDLIKGQFAFAIYDSNLGWVGSLTHLEPNQGYMLYANNADTFTFPVSGIGSGKTADSTPSTLAVSKHWEINRFAYPSNMTVIGQVEWCDLPEITDDLRIGAFDGEECRGIGKLWYDEDADQYQTYLTVYGDGKSKDLTLRLVHEETGIELEMEESLSYEQDDMLLNGFFKASNELSCNKLLDKLPQDGYFSQVTPIPFDSELEIEFTLEESGDVEVLVFDMAGKPIATLLKEQKERGNWTLNWDAADYPLGMYVVLIRTPQFTHTHKALKAH